MKIPNIKYSYKYCILTIRVSNDKIIIILKRGKFRLTFWNDNFQIFYN